MAVSRCVFARMFMYEGMVRQLCGIMRLHGGGMHALVVDIPMLALHMVVVQMLVLLRTEACTGISEKVSSSTAYAPTTQLRYLPTPLSTTQ
eukprot:1158392-Rhodomonas_salina.1